MKTKVLFIALLAMLLAVFMAPNIANAVQHHNAPFRDAEVAYLTVNADPNGATFLVGVLNTDDDPLNMHLLIRKENGTVIYDREFSLAAHQVRTWNFRDLPEVLANLVITDDYPQGVFHGSTKVIGDRRVLVGDFFQVDTDHNRAEGNILIPNREKCPTSCDAYVLRYLQGGAFDGGTCVQVLHRGGAYETPTIDVELFGEGGNQLPGFSIPDALESSEFCLVDYAPQEPFGSAWIYPPTNDAVVTAMYDAVDRYSVGLEAWCIPPCDHCDPLGACYDYTSSCGPQCHPPLITLSPTGDSACQVGVPCHVTFVLTGTGLQPLTCDPLPDGLVRNENTITGTATNMEIPNIHCSVVGTCGNAERSVPILPPGSTYGVGVAVHPRDKDCLEPGEPTAQAHVDFEITNTGNVPETINLTTSIPGCNFTNILIAGGSNTSRSCVGDFPLGTTTVTATATIVGRPESDTSEGQVIITECPEICDGVQPPTVPSFTQIGEDFDSVFTRGRLVYTGPGVSGRFVYSPLPEGGFNGGPVVSGQNYDSSYDKTSSDRTVFLNWEVQKGGEICHQGTESLIIHAQNDCDDYTIPVPQFGTVHQNLTTTSLTVTGIDVTNGLICSWQPVFPQTEARPAWNQPAGLMHFVCTANYTPPNTTLLCPTSAPIDVPVPPREPVCADFSIPPTPTFTPQTTQTATTFTVTGITANPALNGGSFSPGFPQTRNRPAVGQPPGSIAFVYSGNFTPTGTSLSCPASYNYSVPVPPQADSCDVGRPTLTLGNHTFSETGTSYTVLTIPYSTNPNTSGTFACVPSLPDTTTKPVFGQPAITKDYVCTLTYVKPSGLTCTVSKTKPITIPVQTCAVSYPPTWTVPAVTQGSTNLSATNSVGSTGEWELNIHATSSLSECNAHNYDHWYKDSEKVDLACGQGTTALSVSYQWAGHPDEYWRVEVVKDGTRVWESSCIQNTHNLADPSPDKDLMIDDGVVNVEPFQLQ